MHRHTRSLRYRTLANTARTTIEPAPQKKMLTFSFYYRCHLHGKGLQDLSKNGNCDGIQIIICYKCNVKWLRIVQATCQLRNRMDLIKFGNFIFFRNFSSKKNIWVFSKFLVIFYWKKLSCLEMHFAPSWAVWAIKLFFEKYFLEKVFLWKVK